MPMPWEEYAGKAAPAPWEEYGSTPKGESMSRMEKFTTGLADPIHGGAQLLEQGARKLGIADAINSVNNWLADKTGIVARLPERNLSSLVTGEPTGVDALVRKREQDYQAKRTAAGESGFDGYRVLGNVASPANLALGYATPAAATLPMRMLAGAGGGAATSALNPVTEGDFGAEKLKQVGTGAAFGAAVPAVTGALSRVISPNASTNPNVQLLRNEGVTPTVGQALGGWANRAEEKAMSLPIMGDAIAGARENARRQFNEAAINRATAPIGARPQGVGQGGVQRAGDDISDAYDAARSALGSFQLDQQGLTEIARIRQMVQSLPQAQQNTFQNTLNAIRTDISPNGTIPAGVYKRIDSRIGQDAARFSGSPDPYHQQLGDALTALQNAITGSGRRANPQADAMFTNADRAYANLVRVEGASKAAMNNEGVFTPGQLNMAVRQADQSVRDRATARGTALMQDLGNAGQQVLGNKVPNSGTADRLMLGGAGLGAYFVDPSIPAGLLSGAALYTQPMQRLLSGAVSARPQGAQALSNAVRQSSPLLVPLGAQVGLGLLN